MVKASGLVALVLASGFVIAACSGGSTSDIAAAPGADGGVTGTDGATPGADGATPGADAGTGPLKCDSIAKALCDKIAACTQLVPIAWGDIATCVAQTTESCNKGVTAPGMSVTQAQIDACAAANTAASCADLFANKQPAACKLAGSLADGAACGSDGQCAGSHCRKPSKGANCGTCGKVALAAESCTRDEDCTPGLNCNSQNKCAARAQLGESCGVNECAYAFKCFDGKCVTPLGEGAACTRATDNSEACDLITKLDYCGLDGTCQKLQLATKAGQACGLVSGKFVLCTFEAKCTGGIVPGVCEAPRGDGAACDDKDNKCSQPFDCDAGKCIKPDPTKCK